jgi:hypothetical protein
MLLKKLAHKNIQTILKALKEFDYSKLVLVGGDETLFSRSNSCSRASKSASALYRGKQIRL